MKKIAVLSIVGLFAITSACDDRKEASGQSTLTEAAKMENTQIPENKETDIRVDQVNTDQPVLTEAKKEEETHEPLEKSETYKKPGYDPNRGEGKFKNVKIEKKLNVKFAEAGSEAYDVKCASCHKLTDEKLVGPGWAGVTKRRHPGWIMNFMSNPDVMLDKDPAAKEMLELCAVRMPNQNLSDEEMRNLLEFMRKNDGVRP